MAGDSTQVATQFFAAARTLACHTGTLQDRLADAYADHLLSVTVHDLPADLQPSFRQIEERLNRGGEALDDEDDPIQAAARELSDVEARALIDSILMLFGRMVGAARHT
jgi:hypothetical protein